MGCISTEIKRSVENNERAREIIISTIPKTMDNDILWAWQSFGFMSAVDKAKEFAIHLHTEAKSNPRLCVMQLFGSDSGFVVSHAALASNVCDLALIPEVEFDTETIFRQHIKNGSSVLPVVTLDFITTYSSSCHRLAQQVDASTGDPEEP